MDSPDDLNQDFNLPLCQEEIDLLEELARKHSGLPCPDSADLVDLFCNDCDDAGLANRFGLE